MSASFRKLIDTFKSKESNNLIGSPSSICNIPTQADESQSNSMLQQPPPLSKASNYSSSVGVTKFEIGSSSTAISNQQAVTVSAISLGMNQAPLGNKSQPENHDHLPSSNESNLPFNILENSRKLRLSVKQTVPSQNRSLEPMMDLLDEFDLDDIDGLPISPVSSALTDQSDSPTSDSDIKRFAAVSTNPVKLIKINPKQKTKRRGRPKGSKNIPSSTKTSNRSTPSSLIASSSKLPTISTNKKSNAAITNATVINPKLDRNFSSPLSEPMDMDERPRMMSPSQPIRASSASTRLAIAAELSSDEELLSSRSIKSPKSKSKLEEKEVIKSLPTPTIKIAIDYPVPMVTDQKVKLPKPKPPKIVIPEKKGKKLKSLPITKAFVPPFNFSLDQVYQIRRPKLAELPSEWFCSFCDQTCDPRLEGEYKKPFKKVQDASPVGAALVGEHILVCTELGEWKGTLQDLWNGLIENTNDPIGEDRSLYKTRRSRSVSSNGREIGDCLGNKRKSRTRMEETEPQSKKVKVKHESSNEKGEIGKKSSTSGRQSFETQPESPVVIEVKIPKKRLVKKGPPASQIEGSWVKRDEGGIKYPILSEELLALVEDRVEDPKKEESIQARTMTLSPQLDSHIATIGDMVAQVGMARASSTAEPKVAKVSPVRVPKPPKPAKVFKVKIPNSKPRSSYSREEAMAKELRTLQSSHFSVDLTNFGRRTVIPPNIRRAATEQELSELLDPVGKHKKKISFNSNTILPQLPVLSNCDTIDKVVERIILPPGLKENEREKELKDQNLKEIALEKAEIAARTLSVMKKKPRMTYKRKIKLRELVQSRKINFQIVVNNDPTAELFIAHKPTAASKIQILHPISITRTTTASIPRTIYHYHIPSIRYKQTDGLFSIKYSTGNQSRIENLLLKLDDGLVRGTVTRDGEFKWKGADRAKFRVLGPDELFDEE